MLLIYIYFEDCTGLLDEDINYVLLKKSIKLTSIS